MSKENECKYLQAIEKEEAVGLAVQDQAASQEEQMKKTLRKCDDLKAECCAATRALEAADKLNKI